MLTKEETNDLIIKNVYIENEIRQLEIYTEAVEGYRTMTNCYKKLLRQKLVQENHEKIEMKLPEKEEEKINKCGCCGYEFLSKPHLKLHKEIVMEKAGKLVNYLSPISIRDPEEKVKYEDITFYSCDNCSITILLDSAHTAETCDKDQRPF